MSVAFPTPTQLRAVAEQCGLSLTEEDVASFRGLMQGSIDAYNWSAAMPDEVPEVKYPRTPGYRPVAGGKSAQRLVPQVDGQGRGLRQAQGQDGRAEGQHHAGRRADDERLGDAGRLRARFRRHHRHPHARCGRRDRSARCTANPSACPAAATPARSGPVHNPHKMGYSAGGSSSGSGVVVALGEADMAIGGDQGGSIRMPASFCGIYGMKPTWGWCPTPASCRSRSSSTTPGR